MPLPTRIDADGRFPFGRPNGPRGVTWGGAGSPQLLVIGVYPSALHVGWRAPATIPRPQKGVGGVRAMAVDVEPEVFWDGSDAADQVSRWKQDVGFVDGDLEGTDGHAEAFGNGPSGKTLRGYLDALNVDHAATAYLDVYPVFVVHRSAGSQGRAVERDYDPVSPLLSAGREPSTLPTRPSAARLPRLAAERFGPWLAETIETLQPELIVTLGEESWAAVRLVGGVVVTHDHSDLSATRDDYGREGSIRAHGREVPWIPLAHPGLLGKSQAWASVHKTWADQR